MGLEGLSVFCWMIFPKEFSGDCVTCVPVWKKHPAPGLFFFLGAYFHPKPARRLASVTLMSRSRIINYQPKLIYRKGPKFPLAVAEILRCFG